MRLFTAIDPPEEIAQLLAARIAEWKPHARLRWSPARNLHLTTKFIGESPAERLDELKSALEAISQSGPFSITLRGLGWFPNAHSPRIFWVSAQGGEALRTLASATEAALEPLGITAEKRAYTPHLTLARIEPGADIAELRRQVGRQPVADWGEFGAREFHLYESRPGTTASIYSRLHTISL